jgi:hypothetical protein
MRNFVILLDCFKNSDGTGIQVKTDNRVIRYKALQDEFSRVKM